MTRFIDNYNYFLSNYSRIARISIVRFSTRTVRIRNRYFCCRGVGFLRNSHASVTPGRESFNEVNFNESLCASCTYASAFYRYTMYRKRRFSSLVRNLNIPTSNYIMRPYTYIERKWRGRRKHRLNSLKRRAREDFA